MSSSIWARVARTCFIRPRIGSGPLLGRSYVLLSAKPTSNGIVLSVLFVECLAEQSAVAALRTTSMESSPLSQPAEETKPEEELPQFSSLENVLHPGISRALTQGPFKLTTMSSVQAAVLPLLPELMQPYDPEKSSSRDLMVKAKTGTGKTLAFLIPAVEARLKALDQHAKGATQDTGLRPGRNLTDSAQRQFARKHTGIVIISPTRELATQIGNEARKLVKHLNKFEVHLFVGGENKRQQLRDFKFGTHDIIVATPGRMNDLLESSTDVSQSVAHAQTLILDEADTLLDMGFMPDILNILKFLPPSPERQTFLFSATLSPAIRKIARESLAANHRYINCVSDDAPPTHAHIPQFHTVLPSAEQQIPHILRVLAHDQLVNAGKSKSVVFLPTTKMTKLFAELLRVVKRDTLPAGANTMVYELHSQKAQISRVRASDAFRADKSGASVLITSDVSARGVDYPGVTRVIQVGVPKSGELYVHRVGRTGRAGTQGRGDLIILPFERKFLSSQMDGLPLKPLTVEDQTSELLELAKTYDADPKAFWGGEVPVTVVKTASSPPRRRPLFRNSSLVPVLEDIPRAVSEIIARGDPETYDETFSSLVGYYVGLSDDLKTSKSEILESCKEWAVGACGLPSPSLSASMLEKLGITSEKKRMNRRMDTIRKQGFRAPSKSPWVGRGQRKIREARETEEFDSSDGGYTRSSGGGYRGSQREGYRGSQRDGERSFGGRSEWGGDKRSGRREERGGWGDRGGRKEERGGWGDRGGGREERGGWGDRGGSRTFGKRSEAL
ncbi:hypothetical protein D9756_008237 [Leucocoprinus leucothites]|uniref:ATP-dependent RNA helicase n=1 Tax=Leucocoprinus leucothites TaxID=201217 RepID=A0A8H5CZQ0_9AGAR|nr:hypothetical protein D9756_008237 [Leucoagaricus leucothites]